MLQGGLFEGPEAQQQGVSLGFATAFLLLLSERLLTYIIQDMYSATLLRKAHGKCGWDLFFLEPLLAKKWVNRKGLHVVHKITKSFRSQFSTRWIAICLVQSEPNNASI